MFLASINRRDYLAPLTSAGYGRSTRMARYPMNGARNLVSGSPNVAGGGQRSEQLARRRRAYSTRGSASYRLRLASFMHIHGRPAGGRTRAARPHGRAHDYPIPPRSAKVYLRTYGECTQPRCICGGSDALKLSLSWLSILSRPRLRLSGPSRADIIALSRSCILGLYAVPCLQEVASDLISRLVSFGADPLDLGPTAALLRSRSLSCVLVELQQQSRVE